MVPETSNAIENKLNMYLKILIIAVLQRTPSHQNI
tara:strand:- start:167 stop:271 length:105 start_codon:yes stop_codon:yes gene_type:complete